MARTQKFQSEHDALVRELAREFKDKGYAVEADVSGFSRPATIGGYRPDIVAKKGEARKIVEVETPDSVDSARDTQQQQAFRNTASKSKNTTFSRKVTKR